MWGRWEQAFSGLGRRTEPAAACSQRHRTLAPQCKNTQPSRHSTKPPHKTLRPPRVSIPLSAIAGPNPPTRTRQIRVWGRCGQAFSGLGRRTEPAAACSQRHRTLAPQCKNTQAATVQNQQIKKNSLRAIPAAPALSAAHSAQNPAGQQRVATSPDVISVPADNPADVPPQWPPESTNCAIHIAD